MVPRRRTRQGRQRALSEPALGPVTGPQYYLYARDQRALYDIASGNNKPSPNVPGRPLMTCTN